MKKFERTILKLNFLLLLASPASNGAAISAGYVDLASPFEQIVVATADQPEQIRIAQVRHTVNALLPGIYPESARVDSRLAKALAAFPADRARYAETIEAFPAALQGATSRFRAVFPGFASPLPIYLYHSLGTRDGGADYLEPGQRKVMLFGADMIARLHLDDSLEPFLDHELFHLEHGRSFPDCDQFWCGLWQEGLAVFAAASMTPGATDHQLLLDTPVPIRAATDEHWVAALCFVAEHFDATGETASAQALMGNGSPPAGLPDRFGYYIGYRIAAETGKKLTTLDRLNNEAARPLVRSALISLMKQAKATCATPSKVSVISHSTPHAV